VIHHVRWLFLAPQAGLSQQETTMKFFSRQTRRPASSRRRTARPRLEPLDGRLLLSGFGPADGAYIVEDRAGGDYRDVQIQPTTQAIVAVGVPGNSSYAFGVERYNSDGSPDTSFGNSGLASPLLGPGQRTSSLVLQPDGKVVVAGQVNIPGSVDIGLARLNPDGTPDAGFGSGGWTGFSVQPGADTASGVALQSTGKIVVAGQSNLLTTSPYNPSTLVARFTAGGAIDSGKGAFGQVVRGQAAGYTLTSFTSYSSGSQAYVDVAVQPDDKLVAVGSFSNDGNNFKPVVARYTATGTLDKTFNGKGYAVLAPAGISSLNARAVALQSNGQIVVVGSCSDIDGADDMLVARYNADGTLDTGFAGGAGYVRIDVDGTASQTQERGTDVAIQPDGKIVVAGNLQREADLSGSVMVARLNTDGTLDSTFGVGGIKLGTPLAGTGYHFFMGWRVALQSNGNIIVAGTDDWGTTGDTSHPLLMRFFPTTTSPLQSGGVSALAPSHTNPLTPAQVQRLLTEVVARSQATGADVSGLASLDVRIPNPPDATLGLDSGNTISFDSSASGWDRLVGRSTRPGRVPQAGRTDLLSAMTTRPV
jgi:uncharacterized delta-60 repeat protein